MKKLKFKTHKSTAKRLRLTGSGKIVRNKQSGRNNSHLKNMRKSAKKIMKENLVISARGTVKRVKKLLG